MCRCFRKDRNIGGFDFNLNYTIMTHYESLKESISPQMLKTAAATLREDEKGVASAVAVLLPSLLVRFMDQGETARVNETIREAGNAELFDRRAEVFAGHGIDGGMNLGERFENELVGAENKAYPNAVAAESGISAASADRLSGWVAAVIAGYVGHKIVRNNLSMSAVMAGLRQERGSAVKEIPVKVGRAAGISGMCSSSAPVAGRDGKKNNWLVWLIIVLIVVIIVFLSIRSCNRNGGGEVVAVTENVTVVPTAPAAQTAAAKEGLTFVEHKLPDGRTIRVAEGGCEDCMLKYLQSDAYRKATNEELSKNWIQFDKIDFMHDSETALAGNSMEQLDNIAAILKNYPDVRIRIGGFADKTGTRAVNYEISKKRAEYIKSILVKDGIPADRISTEGFGKDFATVPADATAAQRAVDRSIAMRFTK